MARCVTEVGEDGGFVVAVTKVPEHIDRVLVAGASLGVVAEPVVSVAEAVPGSGFLTALAKVLVQDESLLLSDTVDEDVRAIFVAPGEHPGWRVSSFVCDATVSTKPDSVATVNVHTVGSCSP